MLPPMSKEALVSAVKQIMAQSRSGDVEGSYDAYGQLYGTAEFAANKPEDQRQALKLLILAKRQ